MRSERTSKARTRAARLLSAAGAAALLAAALQGCAPLLVGGAAVGGALIAIDRRTAGVQLEDEAIELKAANRLRETFGERAHVNVTSYNRMVLITGEVPADGDRANAEQVVAKIENVRSTVNELAVMGPSSLTARSNDTLLTGRVKAALVDARDLQANAIKVVTERGTVHLMGRVTEREATRASEVARGVSGVQKVVRVFEILSEAELAALQKNSAPAK
jgi:osmotically-inducible protein OsmY